MAKLKIQSATGQLPRYAHEGDACFDVQAIEANIVPARGSCLIRTGLKFDIPKGHALMVYSRSGHGFVHGIRLANCVGVIDEGYRGELAIRLHNDSNFDFPVKIGANIAQAMLIKLPTVQFQLVDNIDADTERGEDGLGSTGE